MKELLVVIACLVLGLNQTWASSDSLPRPYIREDGRPVVDLPLGTAVGVVKEAVGKKFNVFKSLPFALPPTHERRFMEPEPAEAWDGELDASSDPLPCSQQMYEVLSSEDCLYLNLYSPMNISDSEDLPVMVYFYGGLYALGDIFLLYDRPYQLVANDVIVIVIQYRVGVLGFFSTGDSVAPGNQGLMDQTMSLMWVQDNVKYFGGDPNRVTIFGESAGSSSVNYQLLTPSAEGLFHRAIMQSGTALSPWATGRDFQETAIELATINDCPTNSSEMIVECLQQIWHVKLSNQYSHFIQWNLQPVIFAPRVDGVYLPDEPAVLVKNDQYIHVPTIIGITREDGCLVSGEMYTVHSLIDSLLNNFTTIGPISLELFDDEDPINTSTSVYEWYLGTINMTEDNANDVTNIYSDRLFFMPTDWLTQRMAGSTPVFNYELHHRGLYSIADAFAPVAKNWVCHGDDIPLIFFGGILPGDDQIVADYVNKLWSEFAKTGNPTPNSDILGFEWTATDPSKLTFLALQPEPEIKEDYRSERRAFWEKLPLRINDILQSDKV